MRASDKEREVLASNAIYIWRKSDRERERERNKERFSPANAIYIWRE